ncbi:MAG: transposase [Chloroflexi bacterium]|nr:transposase [Chloroflexota bacterium]
MLELSPLFDEMYAADGEGRASIPPERLLKASLLISLYSVRSERAFCEKLTYHLLFRWLLDMDMLEPSFDHSPFRSTAGGCCATASVANASMRWSRKPIGCMHLVNDEHFRVRRHADRSPPVQDHPADPINVAIVLCVGSRSSETRPSY